MTEHNILADTTLVFAQSARSNLGYLTIEEAYVDAHVQFLLAEPSPEMGWAARETSRTITLRRFLWQTLFQRAELQGGIKTATANDNSGR
jgi:hypothetical protein